MITAASNITNSYIEIIDTTYKSLKKLSTLKIEIPKTSWVYDSLNHALLVEKEREAGNLFKFTSNREMAWKTTVSFGNLSEFNLIVDRIDTLLGTSEEVVLRKLNDVVRMPFRMFDENSDKGTNLGRNSLFELRLATRFSLAGYMPKLCSEHPDILIPTAGYDYPIECKRMFSPNSFENLVFNGISQLEKYSICSKYPQGIVAVSITRYFHQGDKKIYAESSNKIGELADRETEKFVKAKLPYIFRKFPDNIPCLILDFSDFAESDKPYWVHWLYFIETTANPETSNYKYILRDLQKMLVNKYG